MADIEFFFDPLCPWCWITSRWATEVAEQRTLEVEWRFISLYVLNESKFDADAAAVAEGRDAELPVQYQAAAEFGRSLLRIAASVRADEGNEAVAAFYTAAGELLHTSGRSAALWSDDQELGDVAGEALAAAGLPASYRDAGEDASFDKVLREETAIALERTGDDVGTPIITWDPNRPKESSLFGPVINRIPRGEEALRLWDAVETVARTPGIAELKRSLRGNIDFT